MAPRPKRVQYHEGPEAAWRIDYTLARVLSVSKDELDRRAAAYQESRKGKPRPGPKPRK